MNGLRHVLVVVASSLPLLFFSLWAAGRGGGRAVAAAAILWAAGVCLLAFAVWRETVRPHADLLAELDGTTAHAARWRARELKENLERCRDEILSLQELFEDLSAGLGEGLVLLDGALKVRLMNPEALRFAGYEHVRPGVQLAEVIRDPEVLAAARSAAAGEPQAPKVVENSRGVWEVRARPVRRGGALLVVADVGVVRRAGELRRRFVQDLAHEIRSPLAVLRTTVEAMEGEVDGETAALLVRQVERLTRLSEELKELAFIESGELEVRPGPVDVGRLVRDVLADLGREIRGRRLRVRVEVPEGLLVRTDPRLLSRIVSNLVENAVKYNRGGGSLEVRARRAQEGLALVVSDTGVGIPARDLGAVFQRFYRVDAARTPGRGGLGLGLAIVKHLVDRLEGTIRLESREGVGTTVHVELPEIAD